MAGKKIIKAQPSKPKRKYTKRISPALMPPIIEPVKEPELTKDEVFSVLELARQVYSGDFGFPNAYTPLLVSSRLKDVSLNPAQATLDSINAALADPKNNEDQLQGYSEFFELNSMLYKRLLHYLSDMLSWNISYVCTDPKVDYKSSAYQKSYNSMVDFFYHLDIKNEFRIILREMIRRETFFSFLRDEGEKYVFQELPRERCLITARWDYGLLFDFDMLWFIQPGVDIEFYPDIFKEWYNEVLRARNPNPFYNPTTPVDDRSSHWTYWVQTSPEDGFWAFKLSPEIATKVPMFAPLYPDIVSQPIIRQLQTNSYMQEATKLITSQVPMLNKDLKGANVKDNFGISATQLGQFLNLLRQAISSVINVAALPTEDIKSLEFQGNNDIYDSYAQTTAALSGINSRLIYGHERQNALETELSTNVDEYLIKPVYSQFENFLNYRVNKNISGKYHFKFTLSGTEFSNYKKRELADAKDLATLGMVLPQKFAGALNMQPWDFQKQLDEARILGFTDKLTPIISAFQAGGNAGAGRPQKSAGELTESGSDTRSAGSNIEKEDVD